MSRITLDDIEKDTWKLGDVLWIEETISIVLEGYTPVLLTKQNPTNVSHVTLRQLSEIMEKVEIVYARKLDLWRQEVIEGLTKEGFDSYLYRSNG